MLTSWQLLSLPWNASGSWPVKGLAFGRYQSAVEEIAPMQASHATPGIERGEGE